MSIFDDLGSAFGSIVNAIPGSSWIKGAIDSGQTALINIAKNPVGATILTVLGTGLVTQLGAQLAAISIPSVSGTQTIGPQIASVVFAIPGMVLRKQDFVGAYTQEFANRVTGLVAFLAAGGGGAVATSDVDTVSGWINDNFSQPVANLASDSGFGQAVNGAVSGFSDPDSARAALEQAGLDPVTIARQKGIRPDAAATAINGITGQILFPSGTPGTPFSDFNADGSPDANYIGRQLQAQSKLLTSQIAQSIARGDLTTAAVKQQKLTTIQAAGTTLPPNVTTPTKTTAPNPNAAPSPVATTVHGLVVLPGPTQSWGGFLATAAILTAPWWVPKYAAPFLRKAIHR